MLSEGKETPESERYLHPDFKMVVAGRFWQNREWDNAMEGGSPEIKLLFTFADVEELNTIPFVCKFGPDLKGNNRFVGFAYARKEKQKELEEWGLNFSDHQLLPYHI